MDNRLAQLKRAPCDDIDQLAIAPLPADESTLTRLNDLIVARLSQMPPNHAGQAAQYLHTLHALSDFQAVRELRSRLVIEAFDPARYADLNLIAAKVNHGFWEHLAVLNARPEHRARYRDVNLPMRVKSYLSTGFMDVLIASMLRLLGHGSVSSFVSTTTGRMSFGRVLGTPWTSDRITTGTTELSEVRRGAVHGLLAFTEVARVHHPIQPPYSFFDSYDNNSAFENGTLFRNLLSSATSDAVCLIMGPQSLRQVQVAGWPGDYAFLAISRRQAVHQWRFNLLNLFSVLQHYDRMARNVVILFQGSVLGPIIADYLADFRASLGINVAFIDLGRLLDLAHGEDLTNTGSPLPNNSFNSGGQLLLIEGGSGVFQETTR